MQPIELNDMVYCSQTPIEFSGPLNPGAFDYGQFMNKKGIYHQLTLGNFENIIRKSKHISLRHKALIFRDKILASLKIKGFSTKEFSIIQALLLGQKKDLSMETKRTNLLGPYPANSKFLSRWDPVVMSALCFTALVTPYSNILIKRAARPKCGPTPLGVHN